MAYTIWRVFMKKYTKAKYGLASRALPAPERDVKVIRDDDLTSEEVWDAFADNERLEEFSREKHLSKAKKVKNYLKKCKTTANSFIQSRNEQNADLPQPQPNFKQRNAVEESMPHTSWYVTDEFYLDEEPRSHVTVVQMTDAAEKSVQALEYDGVAAVNLTNVLDAAAVAVVDRNADDQRNNNVDCGGAEGCGDGEADTANTLENFMRHFSLEQERPEEQTHNATNVTDLVDKYIGPYYKNYENTKQILVRQARDLLICDYHSDINTFEQEFCGPVSLFLQDIYRRAKIHKMYAESR